MKPIRKRRILPHAGQRRQLAVPYIAASCASATILAAIVDVADRRTRVYAS